MLSDPRANYPAHLSLVDESGSEEPSSPSRSNNEEIKFGIPEATSPTLESVNNEDNPSSEAGMNVPAHPQVKHLAKRRKFRPRDRLAGMISEAKQMWGRSVTRPTDAEEVRQESAFLDNESDANDEEVETPQNRTYARDMEEEHTPRTSFVERMATPPTPRLNVKRSTEQL
jgi:hypothetical protein